MMKIGNLILVCFISGCTLNVDKEQTQRVVYVNTPLTLPDKPKLPKLPKQDLECLKDETKYILLDRDNIMKNYIKQLESIILSTQKEEGH